MRKIELESNMGKLFIINSRIIGVGMIGFLIYSIVSSKLDAVIFLCLMIVFLYFGIFRKTLNLKSVYFDNEFVYLDANEISLTDIDKIKDNKIFYGNNVVKFNMFFCDNVNLLKGFIEDAKMK